MIWLFPYHIPYQPSTIIPRAKALGMILVSWVDTGCDTKEPYNILYILINDLDYAIVVSKDKICLVLVNQKQEIIMAAYFLPHLDEKK